MFILKMCWLFVMCINLGVFLLLVYIYYIMIRIFIYFFLNNCIKEFRKSFFFCLLFSLFVECLEVEKMLKRIMNIIFNI